MKPLTVVLCVLAVVAGCPPATPEEEALAVAREYLAECEDRDFDTAWDLAAAPYRNLWIETHEELRREPGERDFMLSLAGVLERELTREVALTLSPRRLHAVILEKVSSIGGICLPPDEAPHEVKIEGDLAEVCWPERDQRVFLRREDGVWRVEATGPARGGSVWRHEGPGGRPVAYFAVLDLISKKFFEGFPLPRLPGARDVDESGEQIVALRLAEDGAVWMKGIEYRGGKRIVPPPFAEDGVVRIKSTGYRDESLEKVLMRYADTQRDFNDPSRPTVVRLAFGVHPDTPWRVTDAMLRVVALPPIHYRNVALLTEETEWEWFGVAASLSVRFVDRVRQEEPRVTVVIGRAPGTGSGILAALEALPPERLESGVRARLSAGLRSEDVLRALVAVAAVKPRWIVVETDDEVPEELSLDGGPVSIGKEPLDDLGDLVVPLAFEYRSSGK